jgi:WD40 repeat protein
MAVFTPDGSQVALATKPRGFGENKSQIVILRASDGIQTGTLPTPDVSSLAFSPDGKSLLATSNSFDSDHGFRVWSLPGGAAATMVNVDNLTSANFSADGKTVLTVGQNGKVQTWEAASGHQIAAWDVPDGMQATVYVGPAAAVFVRVVAGADNSSTWKTVDVGSGQKLTAPLAADDPINRLVFAPDGSRAPDPAILQWRATACGRRHRRRD